MSWRKIAMKFDGTCIVCKEKIQVNEIGLWAKGLGVKHEKCAETNELKCIICDGPAGCQKCEFEEDCDRSLVSQLCICKKCEQEDGVFDLYQKSLKKKFSILNLP
jgi:hypothetical protein|tara:strand:+ start:3546 stop:3860 length:315 start_codon:yes stop_codon:yes gene_type:complete